MLWAETQRESKAHYNLIHQKIGFKTDCYLCGNDDLHIWTLKNAKVIEIGENAVMRLAPPEYVIIRKLEYFREGGSQKHLADIYAMFEISGNRINADFLSKELAKRNLGDYLKDIL